MGSKLHKILCNRNKKRIKRNAGREVEPLLLTCSDCGQQVIMQFYYSEDGKSNDFKRCRHCGETTELDNREEIDNA